MAEALFGIETEYAIGGRRWHEEIGRFEAVREVLQRAHASCLSLPDEMSSGVFLENGARFYLDSGNHPEFSTPECANPWDAVRYVEAGHEIVSRLIEETNRQTSNAEICCYRSNVDYSGSAATWGCHDSYLNHGDPESLFADLIPHLVTRIVYAGAGGFDPFSPGLCFSLSPRAMHFEHAISAGAAGERGIFHTKNEPLCSRYNRLHVILGDNLCSQRAMFVKVGATSLVVAMAEAGLGPGRDVILSSPLATLHTICKDTTLHEKVELENHQWKSAIEIQRHYLALAEANLDRDFMPPWAPEVCKHWRRILDLLSEGPWAASRSIDWCMKWALYSNHAAHCGLDWPLLSDLCEFLPTLSQKLRLAARPGQPFPLDFALQALQADPELRETVHATLAGMELTVNDLSRLLEKRSEFLEMDTRFGQLGPSGLFSQLDAAGVLDHRVSGIDNIPHAISNPPNRGRAKLRGAVIKRVAGDKQGRWCCNWNHIYSRTHNRLLDLSNPFASAELWYDIPGEQSTHSNQVFS